MAREKAAARRRIGRVSLYLHRRLWYGYFRQEGKAVRRPLGSSEAAAEVAASILNAQIVAESAGLKIVDFVPKLFTSAPGVNNPAPPANIESISIAELRKRFLHHHETVLRSAPRTVARYDTATRHLEQFAAQDNLTSALAVSPNRFTEYLRTIEVAPNGHANAARRRLLDKGVRYILETCRSMFRFAQKHGHLPAQMTNPFSELTPLRIRDARRIFVFTAAQELDFFTAANPWAFAIHFTLAKSGLRPGELVHLLVEDLDLEQGWLHVRCKPELGWSTKTNRERSVPLVKELNGLLKSTIGPRRAGVVFRRIRFDDDKKLSVASRAQLASEVTRRLADSRREKQRALNRKEEARIHEAVWKDAGAIKTDDVRTSFIRLATRTGLAATCPKSWRHTFATLLQEANVDLLVRQETMGHRPSAPDMSALGMTGVYTHTSPAFQRSEIERALRLREASLELVHSRLAVRSAPAGGSASSQTVAGHTPDKSIEKHSAPGVR